MSSSFEFDPEFSSPVAKPRSRRRFSLVEIVSVLAILVILVVLLLPGSRSARGAAQRAQCVNNLKQIALALHNYEQAYKVLPPAHTVDAQGRPLHSWRTLILPYLEQEPLYRRIDLTKPWYDSANAEAPATPPSVFRCPGSVGRENATTYLASVGPTACFLADRPRPLADVTDARGTTLMVIEVGEENAVPWMAPVDADESVVLGLGSAAKLNHPGGGNACFVDGSVRFLKTSTPEKVRRALTTISGHDGPSDDEF